MTIKVTRESEKLIAQWRRAWFLLPKEWRASILKFCIRSDTDVASAALCGSDLMMWENHDDEGEAQRRRPRSEGAAI